MFTKTPSPLPPNRNNKTDIPNSNNKNQLPDKKNLPFLHSFAYAFSGIGIAFLRERNLRIHFGIGTGVLYFGYLYKLSHIEWAILILAIGFVIVCELLNSSIEYLTDLLSEQKFNPLAKATKDIAAGGVLISALISVGVGIMLFGNLQRFFVALKAFALHPLPPILLMTAILLIIFLPSCKNIT